MMLHRPACKHLFQVVPQTLNGVQIKPAYEGEALIRWT